MLQVGHPSLRSFDSVSESSPMESESGSELPSDLVANRFPQEPFVLVPRIVVTPEAKIIGDGATTVWAAVQVFTQVCPARGSDCGGYQEDAGWRAEGYGGGCGGSQEDMFQHGSLCDVSVELFSTGDSQVVEVLNDRANCTSILYPGSRLLIMAYVRVSPARPGQRRSGHVRESSDDLIQDLEYHLGSTTTEYLEIRVTYRHSGFPHHASSPCYDPAAPSSASRESDGIARIQTTMETRAFAIIKRHNSSSFWSPRPAPQPNPHLFDIIACHWGTASAREILTRISARPQTPLHPQRAMNFAANVPLPPSPRSSPRLRVREQASDDTPRSHALGPGPIRAAPPIPARQASLHRTDFPLNQVPDELPPASQSSASPIEEYDGATDPARRIWSQMRRTSYNGINVAKPRHPMSRMRKMASLAALVPSPALTTPTKGPALTAKRQSLGTPTTPVRKPVGGPGRMLENQERAITGVSSVRGRKSMGGESYASTLKGAAMSMRSRGDFKMDGEAKSRRFDGSGGVNTMSRMGHSGIPVGVGLGTGNRSSMHSEGVAGGNHYGTGRGKEKEKGSPKWGWPGWWQ
ncbi:hypothetical protein QBC39DRAFT_94116 [Podospora conica]|nr:hypothetical protein QBC39DRAFT_94116 [Schizothecium conicum]